MYDIWLAIVALDKVYWWYQTEEYIWRPKNHFLFKETRFRKLWSLIQKVPLTSGFKALWPRPAHACLVESWSIEPISAEGETNTNPPVDFIKLTFTDLRRETCPAAPPSCRSSGRLRSPRSSARTRRSGPRLSSRWKGWGRLRLTRWCRIGNKFQSWALLNFFQ